MSRGMLAASLCAALAVTCFAADVRVEQALRAQLAASEAAREQAVREKAALAEALGNLTKRSNNASKNAGIAQQDAATAHEDMVSTVSILQQSADQALIAAGEAQAQARQSASSASTVIWVQIIAFAIVIAGFVNSDMVVRRNHRWLVEATERTHRDQTASNSTLSKLEVNTNSIKDALVKVTGEKAYAEGLKKGLEEKS